MKQKEWISGMLSGLPVALGYLPVSFGIGLLAVSSGMTAAQAVFLSAANLTSAGEAAGIPIIACGGSLAELALTQLVINLRYALMALSLTQKIDNSFRTHHRMLISFGITDEIFGIAAAREQKLTPAFFYGLIGIAASAWVLGTALGAVSGSLLPPSVSAALGIMLYAMFIAIIIPAARKNHAVFFAAASAVLLHILLTYRLPQISDGFSVILCAVISAIASALLFPVPDAVLEAHTSDSPDTSTDRRFFT